MAEQHGKPDTPAWLATWFLFSEDGAPLGQVFMGPDRAMPAVGSRVSGGDGWQSAEVRAFEELRATCAMRRCRVVVRVLG